MKQLLQSVRKGRVFLSEVPPPQVRPNGVLVQTAASVISPGTERAALEFSQMSLFSKARNRPDLVRQVLDKVKRDGFLEAARIALARLDRPIAVGYACAGTVIALGSEATEFNVGDRVACAGAGYAAHAELNYVPRNLAVPIPRRPTGEWVSFDDASFATLGAIALHAVRLGHPGLGERAVVIGLGLIGLLAGQVLRAHGCAVLGIDPKARRCVLAQELGFTEAIAPETAAERVRSFTRGVGADLVLVTAAALDSGPVALARDRATVVSVGATGLDLPRRVYYEKELSLVVSRSCGPGRYDPSFEEQGLDYPVGYVRWTERENMRAFLELVADGRVRVEPLVSHRVPVEDAERAYALLKDGAALGIVLQYGTPAAAEPTSLPLGRVELRRPAVRPGAGLGVSVIGAGAFAQDILLPVLRRLPGVRLRGVVTASGVSSKRAGERFGFDFSTAAPEEIWNDPDTQAVVIATRNNLHAGLVERGLATGKAIFVEKPLCLREDELETIIRAYDAAVRAGMAPLVQLGFNRRFAPATVSLKRALGEPSAPLVVNYRINAGRLEKTSWVLDAAEGGGRILSEVCHFIDLSAFVVGAPPTSVFAQSLGGGRDDVAATIKFTNGGLATIGFYSGGDRSYSKERIEVLGAGAVAVIDDFRQVWLVRNGRRHWLSSRVARQRKGHDEELSAFVTAVREGRPSPIPFGEAVQSTRATLAILESLNQGVPIDLGA